MGLLLVLAVFGFALVVIWLVLGWSSSKKKNQSSRRRSGGGGDPDEGSNSSSYGDRFRQSSSLVGEWLVIPWLIHQCRRRNPLLTASQELQLEQMFKRSLDAWKNGLPAIPLLRATLALAIPESHLAFSLVETLISRYWPGKSLDESRASGPSDVIEEEDKDNDSSVKKEWVDSELVERWGCSPSRVKAIQNIGIKRAILKSLKEGQDLTCPITLESICHTNGKVLSDTAALVQQQQGVKHVFLYKKSALEQWFASASNPGATINPLNRQQIDRDREFFVLS